MKKVIYTVAIGYKPNQPIKFSDCDYICFTDVDTDCGWDVVLCNSDTRSRILASKHMKILPFEYLGGYDYSLYVDSTHIPLKPIDEYINICGDNDMALFGHPFRKHLREEAATCIAQKKDNAEIICEQILKYEKFRYPDNNGLFACGVLMRKHTEAIFDFMNIWWDEIKNHSIRDQLSFGYVLWKSGISITTMPGNVYRNKMFRVYRPKKYV